MLPRLACCLLLVALHATAHSLSGHGRTLLQRGFPQLFASATDFNPPVFDCDVAGRFPFIASIRDRTLSRNHLCGGILIAKNAVLTAAHCVDPRSTRNAIVRPRVHLAGLDLDNPIQKLKTVAAFPHPDWTGDIRDGSDIVILKLAKNSCLTPIKVLGNRKKLGATTYEFFGYGRSDEGGAFTSILQSGVMSLIPKNECKRKHDIDLRNKERCFSGEEGIGVCTGDDGGPLLASPEGLFGLYEELIAIVSYTSGECTEEGAAVFMNVKSYKDWITDTLDSRAFKNA